jgi:formate-dependent nitrite reductase cytochrome c552 subunit
VTCVDCHMTKVASFNANLSDQTLALADHTMLLDTQPCTTCHQ